MRISIYCVGWSSLPPRVYVTPNALTEASNLLAHIAEPAKTRVFETFRKIIPTTEEQYVRSDIACETSEFLRLGLTDSGLIEVAGTYGSILTTDLDLCRAAEARGVPAINFNHLRDQYTPES